MAAPAYNATLVFDDASLLSSAWMHVLFGLPPGFAAQCKTTAEWQLMLKLVDLVRGQHVAAVESDGQIVSFALEPADMTVDWNLRGDTPALLLRRLLICAEEVLRMLSQAELDLMSECIFQLILVLLFCKNDESPAQVAFLDTEVPCARLHSKSDGPNGIINISPTYCPGSPQGDKASAAGPVKADLICSIADAQGHLANYVIELKCLRFQQNAWTRNQIDLMPMHDLMQLEIGKRAGQVETQRNEAANITRVKHLVAEALHQSCSKHSLTLDGQAWPPAESTPVRHLSVVAMGHRVVVSDTSCVGEPSYRSYTLPQINLAPIAAPAVTPAAAPAAAVTSVESLWSRSHEIRAVASWHLGYVRHCAAQFRQLGDAWVESAEVQNQDRRVAEMAAQNRDLQATIARLTAKNEQLMQEARASQAQLDAHAQQAAQAQAQAAAMAASAAQSPPPQSHPQHARQSSGRGVTFQTMVPIPAATVGAGGPMRTPSPALSGAGGAAQARSPSPAAAAPSLPPTSATQAGLPVSRPMPSPVAPRTVAASLQPTPSKAATAAATPTPAAAQAPAASPAPAPAPAVAAAPRTPHKVHFQQPVQTPPPAQQQAARAPQAVQAPQQIQQLQQPPLLSQQQQLQQQQLQQQQVQPQQPSRASYVAAAPAAAAPAAAAASPPPILKSPSVGRVWPPPPPTGAPTTPTVAASPMPAAAAPYAVPDAAAAAASQGPAESDEPVEPSKVELAWAQWSGPRTGSKDKK